MRTYSPTGGLAKGVTLRVIQPPAPVHWSRSVCNGLAQISMQSDQTDGPIRLTATADGLQPAAVELISRKVPLPPEVL